MTLCKVRELLNRGIKVGLGTDCSAGYSTFMLDAMRQASNVSRHLSMQTGDDGNTLGFNEIVFLATLGSAQVLDLDSKIRNFEQGKEFDHCLLMLEERIVSILAALKRMIWRWLRSGYSWVMTGVFGRCG